MVYLRHFRLKMKGGGLLMVNIPKNWVLRFSLFPVMLEIWGAKISRVGVTMGRMEVATCIGCAQTLEDESGGEEG